MSAFAETYEVEGHTLLDREGEKIGTIDEVYADVQAGQVDWALVHTGLFGTKRTFVPLRGAKPDGEAVRVPVEKAQVKCAPRIESGGALNQAEEQELFDHYGVPYTTAGTTTATRAAGGTRTARMGSAEGRAGAADGADDAMTRSEEELRVGVEHREKGRARLRKYVVTEQEQRTVPVSHEEVRLEREPITEANVDQAMSGPEISEAEHEVILHEERPVVGRETVPKERVRMSKDTRTDEETVSEDVRKERIEAEGDREGR